MIPQRILALIVTATIGIACFADVPTSDADKLVAQLGSTKFAEREAALKALEALGPAALPALKRGADAKDPEVRKRVADLIAKYDRQADNELALAPTKVRIKAADAPLAEVLADLAKQANVRMQLAREPADLPGRKITIEIKDKSFWEALDTICREAKCSIRPTTVDSLSADGTGQLLKGVFASIDIARSEQPLVIQDGVLPPCPTAYVGAARIRIVPDRWGNRQRAPGDEHKWMVEVLCEPRVEWQTAPTVQFDSTTGLSISTNRKDDNALPAFAGMPAAGGFVIGGGPANLRVFGAETPNLPRAISRHEIPVYLKVAGPGASAIPELKGALTGAVRMAAQELVSIGDVQKADAATAKAKDGAKLTVRDCSVADDGAVSLKIEVERPGAGGGIGGVFGNAVVKKNIQIGGGGALPPNVAQMINSMNMDGESFKLFDAKNRPYTISIGETSSNNNNGVTVTTYSLECQPPDKEAKPKKLELHGPKRATVDGKFTLRDVPTP
jgi:hypothetical protein